MSEFILQIENLLSATGDPEYRYLLLEPFIFYGLLTGVIMIIAGFFAKAPRLQVGALVLVIVASMAYFPYREARVEAERRTEQVYKISSPSRAKGFAENTQEWLAASWRFKLLFLCAGATLLIGIHRNRIGFGLAMVTILLGLIAAKNAMWLNYQDAIAYHPNLKKHDAPIDRKSPLPPPPAASTKEAERGPAERGPAERGPSAPVAEPVAPAARAQPPVASSLPYAPPQNHLQPYSSPYPPQAPAVWDERIAPPAAPVASKPQKPKQRQVAPLPRY